MSASLLNMVEKRYSQYFQSIQSTLSFASLKSNLDELNTLKEQDEQFYKFILNLKSEQENELKLHELFYSRYSESNVSVCCFRGKLNLNLFMPEINSFDEYLTNKNYFYFLIYDPNAKMLSADKAEIRVGSKYQAQIPDLISKSNNKREQKEEEEEYERKESLIFNGAQSCSKLGDVSIKKYFTRLIDQKLETNEKNHKNCEIIQTRDSIMYDAMKHLHSCSYDKQKALNTFDFSLDSKQSSKLWTRNEMNLFQQGLSKYGKDFDKIRKELVSCF